MRNVLVDARYSEGECLHPEAPHNCSGNIIRSHSVQKALLKQIADNSNRVYTPIHSPTPNNPSNMKMLKRGVNQASTFNGFCEGHDNELFRPIEDNPIQLNRRHIFFLAYRSLCKELYDKRKIHGVDPSKMLTGNGIDLTDLYILTGMSDVQTGASRALHDLEIAQAEMNKALQRKNYRLTRFYAVEFNTIPDILCSGGIFPVCDIRGNPLQDLNQAGSLDSITVSLLPYNSKHGVALFAWYDKSKVNKRFIKSIHSLNKRDIPDAIVRFLFHHIENIFIAPHWWENLETHKQERLLREFQYSLHPLTSPNIDMGPDGNNYVNWKVVSRPNNLKL